MSGEGSVPTQIRRLREIIQDHERRLATLEAWRPTIEAWRSGMDSAEELRARVLANVLKAQEQIREQNDQIRSQLATLVR